MKLYTEEQVRQMLEVCRDSDLYEHILTFEDILKTETPIQLPSDEEMEEKLNVAFGNGYEQGEMDFYKKMKGQGNEYADGYEEGYIRALELVKFQIVERLEKGGNNEQQ